jgi:hypothetical protein
VQSWRLAAGIFALLLVVYNANGREIGSYDSRPTNLAARELLLRGSLALNHVVGATPDYAARWGFMLARDGRYRAVYSPVPAVIAASAFWPLWRLGLVDIRAPLAPQLMAKVTASILVAAAGAMAFLAACEFAPVRSAAWIALALGLGTGFWSLASQTLWQTESAVFGLALAVLAMIRKRASGRGLWTIVLGVGLGVAVTARPQLMPAAAVLLVGMRRVDSLRTALAASTIVAGAAAVLAVFYLRWFGHPLGALPLLTTMNADIHRVGSSFGVTAGFAGLLISPSRGILVFSPIVLVPAAEALGWCRRKAPSLPAWCAIAAAAQFLVYGAYTVWWGGHTYGPRYLLDVLPLLVPAAAVAMSRPHRRLWTLTAAAMFCWSVLVAGTGAFCYPHDAWNSSPSDVDRNHARLWSLTDNQIRRCWQRGLSPQNHTLFDRAAYRRD